eukprot:CAMPEP_0113937208 /NCGR_PEP_ID=MMETSP1339-20121228/3879_1 /TAXON_ID=94617 /ORGANISM="Fibrocapsa japonica" /LENGTH=444 /DNA_ID=CAMNT_0000939893 /DNA_START=228 /DNA_END=1562 /DNA_ORIENTATION=- /assembly_acc=CAM_ASM_000762
MNPEAPEFCSSAVVEGLPPPPKKPTLCPNAAAFSPTTTAMMQAASESALSNDPMEEEDPDPSLVVLTHVQHSPETGSSKAIGTHSGTFHCDEALAVAMLKCLPQFAHHVVVRTRDPAQLSMCEVVVDVGGEYDPNTLRFDHHQRTFSGTLISPNSADSKGDAGGGEAGVSTANGGAGANNGSGGVGTTIKLSSAGLVYKHFGRDVLRVLAQGGLPEKVMEKVYLKVYKGFVEHVDGIDNGVDLCPGGKTPQYAITTHLSARVSRLNPPWNCPAGPDHQNRAFKKAVALTGAEFGAFVGDLVHQWWPARAIVQRCMANRWEVDPSGEVMVLDQFCPWKSHLYDLEEEEEEEEKDKGEGAKAAAVKYVLYTDQGGQWRVQAVAAESGSFQSRLALPPPWRGLRDQDLSTASGIPGCIFVHTTGFIGGNLSFEGALKMALDSLKMQR